MYTRIRKFSSKYELPLIYGLILVRMILFSISNRLSTALADIILCWSLIGVNMTVNFPIHKRYSILLSTLVTGVLITLFRSAIYFGYSVRIS